MTRRTARVAAVGLLCASLASCSRESAPTPIPEVASAPAPSVQPAPSESSLAPVRLPDLSSAAPAVQSQIQLRFRELAQVLADNDLPATSKAQTYAALGHHLLAATFFDEAALCYAHAEALVPGEVTWPYLRAHALLRKGNRQAAVPLFERAVALQPDNGAALVWLAEAYLDLGRAADAERTFARALARNPESAAALFGAGRAALARGDYAAAVTALEHARARDPKATAINYPLAMALRGVGRKADADPLLATRGTAAPALEDPLLQSASIVLDSAVSYEGLGMEALRRQDWTGAQKAFRRGLEVAPSDPSLRYWLATALIAGGNADAAEREFRTVVREHPDYAKAHFSLGAVLDQRGRRDEALREYEAAVRTAPNMPDARARLGEALRAQGRFKDAAAQFAEAVQLDPNQVPAWVGGAQVLSALGDATATRDWLTRARRLHPANPALARLESQLR